MLGLENRSNQVSLNPQSRLPPGFGYATHSQKTGDKKVADSGDQRGYASQTQLQFRQCLCVYMLQKQFNKVSKISIVLGPCFFYLFSFFCFLALFIIVKWLTGRKIEK